MVHGSDVVQAPPAGLVPLLGHSYKLSTLAGGFVFTEGPIWDQASQSLLFNDIRADSGWSWSEQTGARLRQRPNFIANGMVLGGDGQLVMCEHVSSTVVRVAPDGSRRICAYHYAGKYLNSPNDVVTRSDGSVYFTDPNYGRWDHPVGVHRRCELSFQGLFRAPADGGPLQLLADEGEFDQPNGLCFSPDETVLYVGDRQGIKRFEVGDDGRLAAASVLHWDMGQDASGVPGEPDGMKCDELGNVWCGARGGVWVISPKGDLLGVIPTPEVTANLTWGGPDWHSLFLCMSTTLRVLRTQVGPAPLPYHPTSARRWE